MFHLLIMLLYDTTNSSNVNSVYTMYPYQGDI